MLSRYECSLNGVSLASLDKHIYVRDIQQDRPEDSAITQPRGNRHGAWLLGVYREPLTVTVLFQIRDQDIVRREQTIQAVNAWAREGVLTANNHPGQYLYVQDAGLTGGSALKWTDDLGITFHAYACPFWRNLTADAKTFDAGTEGSGSLFVRGSEDTPVEVTVQNDSGAACDEVSLTVDGATIAFEDLGLASGSALKITYDQLLRQSIMIGNTSVRSKRTEESADDLMASGGKNTVSYTADQAVTVTLSAKGAWK